MLFLMRLLLLTGAVAGIDQAPPLRLHLGWHEVDRAPADEFEGATREVASLLAQAGVETAWCQGLDANGEMQGEIVVVVVDTEARGRHAVMGAASARTSRAVWIFRRNVVRGLGLEGMPLSSWSRNQRAMLAQALGRVAAHEIVHALAPGRPHDRGGLMAGVQGRSFLLGKHVKLSSEVRAAVRNGAERRLRGVPARVATLGVGAESPSVLRPKAAEAWPSLR